MCLFLSVPYLYLYKCGVCDGDDDREADDDGDDDEVDGGSDDE